MLLDRTVHRTEHHRCAAARQHPAHARAEVVTQDARLHGRVRGRRDSLRESFGLRGGDAVPVLASDAVAVLAGLVA